MEFLKSTLTSALSKGPPFPYTFQDRVTLPGDDSTFSGVFTLYNGTKREDGAACSIFSFEINDSTRSRLPLARNALRRLRTLRHPGVVRVLETVETDSYIYIATERVMPLAWYVKRGALQTETIKWGLWSVAITLRFLNEEAKIIHGKVGMGAVFVSESGEWKLGGFEVLSTVADDEPFIYRYGSLLPDSGRLAAPEIGKGGWEGLKSLPIHVTDSWGFALLMYEAFNGTLTSTDQLTQPKKVPPAMQAAYKRLITANPKMRLSVAHFLAQGRRTGGFFDIPLIRISEFVENMGIRDQSEREEFLDELEKTGDQFPEDFFKMKVLPELLKSVEFGGGGPKVFGAVLQIGEKLGSEEWENSITPVVVRLFALPDRATRVFLLDNLGRMIEHLSNKVVNDKIFPDMLTGFSDSAPIVREQTVKAVLTIVSKLSERNINGDLLKHLAKTQNDEQPGIRTNTTICLGKIARNLGPNTRQKVLVAAFTRSLRDPFVHARNSALLALSATADVFDENDCASKVVPAIAPSLVDKEKMIREQAAKTMEQYLARIKTLTKNYPETVLPSPEAMASSAAAAAQPATVVMPGGWTSWAVGTLTAAAGQMQSRASPALAAVEDRPASAPITQSAPAPRPAAPKPSASASAFVPQPGGFLEDEEDDDDDGADGWGALDDDGGGETFLDALEKKVGKKVSPTATAVNKNNLAAPTGSVSSFGPKPFSLRSEEEVDFEALVGAKKSAKALPKGLVKKTTTTTTTVKKPIIARKVQPKVEKKVEAWDEGDADWGDDGWS
ncbi:armadillo-type protein [Sphaerosporella brunnea]|uniref:Armadillo-type protein n=1 Tax=Sphaerosporella brunnea TaxID=1250544 RepID=A0A5J5ESG0_9PEZI|nr:armadillo-type protein [Sphaerosporella brunnea]